MSERSAHRQAKRIIPLAVVSAVFACCSVSSGAEELPPELAAREVRSDYGMVATGSPEATMAGVSILERGGNAVDAAVAAALVLGVADADASGIGGMTYMLIRLSGGQTVAIDGTARVPSVVDLDALGAAKRAGQDFGYQMVGVPTTLAVLDLAIRTYGTMSMAEALQPAIAAAEGGYSLSPILATWTRKYYEDLVAASDYLPFLLMADGRTIGKAGDLLCNHDLARTLREIARNGVGAFYRGTIADIIEADMKRHGGHLRKNDLASLRVHKTRPATTTYRGHEILTVPAPAGGDRLVDALDILETYSPAFLAEDSLARHQVFIESIRIALGGRVAAGGVSVGWPAVQGDRKEEAKRLARMIEPGKVLPDTSIQPSVDPECLPQGESTTHISIIDGAGNTVSMTQTLGQSFGSKIATPGLGFVYNNFLASFKVDKPHCPGFLHPRGPWPNDMAPTIVVDSEGRILALGSPGSNRIPSILAGIISHLVDRGLGLRQAIEAPRILWGGGKEINVEIEIAGPFTDADIDAFNSIGYDHPVEAVHFPGDPSEIVNSGGVNAVAFDPTSATFVGVVDPRRGGLAEGPRVASVRR